MPDEKQQEKRQDLASAFANENQSLANEPAPSSDPPVTPEVTDTAPAEPVKAETCIDPEVVHQICCGALEDQVRGALACVQNDNEAWQNAKCFAVLCKLVCARLSDHPPAKTDTELKALQNECAEAGEWSDTMALAEECADCIVHIRAAK